MTVSEEYFPCKVSFLRSILVVWKTQQRSLAALLLCTLIVYVALVIIFLPFRFIIWLISFAYKFAPSMLEWFEEISSARTLLFKLITVIPLLAVFVMNNLLGTPRCHA